MAEMTIARKDPKGLPSVSEGKGMDGTSTKVIDTGVEGRDTMPSGNTIRKEASTGKNSKSAGDVGGTNVNAG